MDQYQYYDYQPDQYYLAAQQQQGYYNTPAAYMYPQAAYDYNGGMGGAATIPNRRPMPGSRDLFDPTK